MDWARERAAAVGVDVTFRHRLVFDLVPEAGAHDLVYDAGCLHHLAPHRRPQYVDLVQRALRPGGRFGLVCFRPEGGSGLTDGEVYRHGTLGGGLGFCAEQLRTLWNGEFAIEVLRPMDATVPDRFGEEFLWAMLAERR